jgi:hypothetical protein
VETKRSIIEIFSLITFFFLGKHLTWIISVDDRSGVGGGGGCNRFYGDLRQLLGDSRQLLQLFNVRRISQYRGMGMRVKKPKKSQIKTTSLLQLFTFGKSCSDY